MKINKKAFIDTIMLGLFLIFSTVIFVGTVSDKLAAKNKVSSLRLILQTASLSAVKYYVKEDSTTAEAENIARGIIVQTPLGKDINASLVFNWYLDEIENTIIPDNLIVQLPAYTQKLFWFSFLGWDSKSIENMSSKANIVDTSPTDGFAPIAINGCEQTFNENDNLSLLLGNHEDYNDTAFSNFFPVWTETDNANSGMSMKNIINNGHNRFVDWVKNGMGAFIDGVLDEESLDNDDEYTIIDSNINAADVSMLAKYMNMDNFVPIVAAVTILPCGTLKDDPIDYTDGILVKLTGVSCSPDTDKCCFGSICSPMFCIFNDMAEEFTGINWITDRTKCEKDYFKMDFTILNNNKVILEY